MWLTDRCLGIPIPGGLVLAVPDVDGLFLLNPLDLGGASSGLGCGFDCAAVGRGVWEATLRHWEKTFKNRQAEAPIAHLAPIAHSECFVCLNGVRLRIEIGVGGGSSSLGSSRERRQFF